MTVAEGEKAPVRCRAGLHVENALATEPMTAMW